MCVCPGNGKNNHLAGLGPMDTYAFLLLHTSCLLWLTFFTVSARVLDVVSFFLDLGTCFNSCSSSCCLCCLSWKCWNSVRVFQWMWDVHEKRSDCARASCRFVDLHISFWLQLIIQPQELHSFTDGKGLRIWSVCVCACVSRACVFVCLRVCACMCVRACTWMCVDALLLL